MWYIILCYIVCGNNKELLGLDLHILRVLLSLTAHVRLLSDKKDSVKGKTKSSVNTIWSSVLIPENLRTNEVHASTSDGANIISR